MQTASYTKFNNAQIHLLDMLSRCNTDESLDVLKDALCQFYAKEVDKELDRLWDNGTINDDVIEKWGREHMRTPYIHA